MQLIQETLLECFILVTVGDWASGPQQTPI